MEIDDLLSQRPDAWEYLYFAASLQELRDALEDKYHDFEARSATPFGHGVDDKDAVNYLLGELDALQREVDALADLFAPDVLERAFGAPGEAGEPTLIRQLAEGWTAVYEGMLDWSARVRGIGRPDRFGPLFDTVASLAERPVAEYRDYVDGLKRAMDDVPAALAAGRPVSLSLVLNLSVDDAVLASLHIELARLGTHT